MVIVCFFDLPMVEKKDLKAYRKFRRRLLKEGFHMMQFSVYAKTCPTRNVLQSERNFVRKICPKKGNVRTLAITEKQYQDIEIIVGTMSLKEKLASAYGLIIV